VPILALGRQAGALQSANIALLGAACAMGVLPLTLDDLKASLRTRLKAAILDVNLRAAELGAASVPADAAARG